MAEPHLRVVSHDPTRPDESAVNMHIGRRLRRRRKLMGMTQTTLAAALNVHFQQIQKYECAANRVSAARLLALAGALQIPIQYFFDGLETAPRHENGADDPTSRESHDLLAAYYALTPSARQRLLSFIKALSDESALTSR